MQKMPFINRVTRGCSPNVVFSPSVIISESAERAVLIALYPKPCLKRDERNSRHHKRWPGSRASVSVDNMLTT